MDSTKAHDFIAFDVLNNTNEGLYRQDPNNEPILGPLKNMNKVMMKSFTHLH